MSTRLWTLVAWALAAASALFWGLKLFVPAPPPPPHTQTADASIALRGDVTRLLGADAPPPVAAGAPEPAADARFQLVGVVSPRSAQAAKEGLALIAVDGKPAKAFRVGAVVDGQTVLQGVGPRGATLGPRGGAALVALNIAPPLAAATGTLPPAFVQPGQVAFPQGGRPGLPPPQVMPPVVQPNPNGFRRPLQGAQDSDPSVGPQPAQTPESVQTR